MSNTIESPASTVRAALRERGYSSRDVSVRNPNGGSVTATIRAPHVDPDAVREALAIVERIHRDDATGEILSGGNVFTHVEWSPSARAAKAAPMLAAATAAWAASEDRSLERNSFGAYSDIDGAPGYFLGWNGSYHARELIRASGDGRTAFRLVYSAADLAFYLACGVTERGTWAT
jgi:hypothetical protein